MMPQNLQLSTSATSSAASSFESSPIFGSPPESAATSLARQVVIGVAIAVVAFFVTRALR